MTSHEHHPDSHPGRPRAVNLSPLPPPVDLQSFVVEARARLELARRQKAWHEQQSSGADSHWLTYWQACEDELCWAIQRLESSIPAPSGVWVEEIKETTFYGTAKESAISGLMAEMEMLAEEEGLDLDSLADSAASAFMPPDSERVPMSRDEAEAMMRPAVAVKSPVVRF